MVQWLRFCVSTAGCQGSIPSQGSKIPQVTWPKNFKKKSIIYKLKTSHTATPVIWGRMGCVGECLIPAHMKVISPTDEVNVKLWGTLGL